MATARFHLTLPGALRDEPILTSLPRRFDLEVTVGRAHIEEDSGWVIVDMEGDGSAIVDAEAWLREQGITVERIEA
jgi:ABC-type methionine transport system ATPase subunit